MANVDATPTTRLTLSTRVERYAYLRNASTIAVHINRDCGRSISAKRVAAILTTEKQDGRRKPRDYDPHSGDFFKSREALEHQNRAFVMAIARYHVGRGSPNQDYWQRVIDRNGKA